MEPIRTLHPFAATKIGGPAFAAKHHGAWHEVKVS